MTTETTQLATATEDTRNLAMSRPKPNRLPQESIPTVATLDDLAKLANYSLMDTLNCDPDAKVNGVDHAPRRLGRFLGTVDLS